MSLLRTLGWRVMSVALVATLLSVQASRPSPAAIATLTGKAGQFDYGFEGNWERPGEKEPFWVTCSDVAAVNLLKYLHSTEEILKNDNRSVKQLQEDFHKLYDPKLEQSATFSKQLADSLKAFLGKLGYGSTVKRYLENDLKYKENLLREWNGGGLIILNMFEHPKPVPPAPVEGHSIFLWGLEDDPDKPKKLHIIDPNVYPNTDVKIDGKSAREGTIENGVWKWKGQRPTIGCSTLVDLNIGTDADGLPPWLINYETPETFYSNRPDDNPPGPYKCYEKDEFSWRIASFVSVSDVAIPEPSSLIIWSLGGVTIAGIGWWRRERAA